MAYYDPKTWQTIDPSKVYGFKTDAGTTDYYTGNDMSRLQGADYSSAYDILHSESSPYSRIKSGDLNNDFLAQYGGTGQTQNYLKNLMGQGYKASDLDGALQTYFSQPGHGEYKDRAWLGDQALIRAFGTGLDAQGKTTNWKDLYNPDLEKQQQAGMHDMLTYDDGNDWDEFTKVLSGLGMVAGVGALGGAFGGGGLFGGGNFPVGGADWMSEIAAGAGNGGASLGSAAGAAADASWGVNPRGGGMDWLDEILGNTQGDAVWNTSGNGNVLDVLGNSGVTSTSPPAGTDLADWWAQDSSVTPVAGGNTIDGGPNGLISRLQQLGVSPSQAAQIAQKMFTSGGTAATAQGSALSRILSGQGTAADWTSLGGTGLTGLLSGLSASKYADNAKEIADRTWNAGDPYRNRLEATYTNPGAYLDSPEVKAVTDRATGAMSRALSARDGNPVGSGRALTEINDYAGQTMLGQLNNQRNMLASYGGLPSITGAAIPTAMNSAEAGGNIYNSLANTVSRATQPQTDWQSIMKSFGFANSLQ